jgi:hypothetical protein
LLLPLAAHAAPPLTTDETVTLLREALQNHLKDADSAKFRNVRFGAGEYANNICGDLNAKNSYGAYGGYNTFMASYIDVGKPKPYMMVIVIDNSNENNAASLCSKFGI